MPAVPAPLPDNESARLAALQNYNVLDTAPEPAFDDIAEVAAYICHAPISLVSLVDGTRQWFKSHIGLDETATPREMAFCAHAILQPDVFVVPNALEDSRFATNPLVTSAPDIRFYAGAPLITSEGLAVGTLCVIDRVARSLTPEQRDALQVLSRQVVAQLELRRHLAELESLAMTDSLTGVHNVRAFRQRLQQEFHRMQRGNGSLSLLLLDVDKFKSYNDTYGHPAGDTALRTVAQTVKNNVRDMDFAARYGGEEFVVILPETDRNTAVIIAERLRNLLESSECPLSPLTVSFGVATCNDKLTDSEALVEEADRALYAAKFQGRNRVIHHDSLQIEMPVQATLQEWKTFVTQQDVSPDEKNLLVLSQHPGIQMAQAYDATIEGWSSILDLRDKETEGHSERVTEMSVRLAQKLGLNEEELLSVRWGALLHDIGKMGIPDSILLKPGPLDEAEWVIMKKHPAYAYEMLSPIAFLQNALDIPYCHHEKWDGSGYPRGLKAEEIPMTARIFAIVDVWDALNSDRPYRKGWPEAKTLAYIREQAGTHFDSDIVKAFLAMFTENSETENRPYQLAA